MAEACVFTANKTSELQQKREEIIEMNTFKSNVKTESTRSKKPEVAIDNSYAGKKLLKIPCVGDYSGSWSKGVYIEDYSSSDETISKNPHNNPVIGVDFSIKILYDKLGGEIRLQIWNIGEQLGRERYSHFVKLYYRNSNAAIVFWGAMSHSMNSAVKWKQHISQVEPDIPIILIVDNVFKTPAKWIGQGLVMNSTKEMDCFCLEHGFFAWFEMLERAGGEKSVFGQAMSVLINEIISGNTTSAQSWV